MGLEKDGTREVSGPIVQCSRYLSFSLAGDCTDSTWIGAALPVPQMKELPPGSREVL